MRRSMQFFNRIWPNSNNSICLLYLIINIRSSCTLKQSWGKREHLLLAVAFKKWYLEIELWWLDRQGNGLKIQWALPAQVGILLTAFLSEIKRCWLLGGKTMINLDSVLKSRHITWPTNVHIVKAMVFQ